MKTTTYWFDNELELVWRLLPRQVLRFNGSWWVDDGQARGVLVRVKTWHGDTFYTRPQNELRWKDDCRQCGCTK